MSTRDIQKFCKDYKNLEKNGTYLWKVLDQALVGICQAYPAHTSVNEVFSKVAIINRTYRANLHFAGNDAEEKLAKAFVKHGFDSVVAPLLTMNVLASENLPTLIKAHGRVVFIVRRVTERTNNSFVSKYLHFHFPHVVPIFDKNAYGESWRLAPVSRSEWPRWENLINCDYGFHCASVVTLLDELKSNGVSSPSVKLMDVLLFEGNG